MTAPHETSSFSNELFEKLVKTGSWYPGPSPGSFLSPWLCQREGTLLSLYVPDLQVEN